MDQEEQERERGRRIDEAIGRAEAEWAWERRHQWLNWTPFVPRNDPMRQPLWESPRRQLDVQLQLRITQWQLKWSLRFAELGALAGVVSVELVQHTGSLWWLTPMTVVFAVCAAQIVKWFVRGLPRLGKTWRTGQINAAIDHLTEHDPTRPY